jgi:hypothetical protein
MRYKSFRLIGLLVLLLFISHMAAQGVKAYPELSLSQESFNYGRCTKGSIPTKKLTIKNIHNNPTKVTLTPSQSWIHLSETSFEAVSQEIEITLDATNLSYKPGIYLETIQITSDVFSFTIPLRLDLVEKKVTILLTLDNSHALVDDKEVKMEAAPFIYSGKTMIPIGIVCDSFGATSTYDPKEKNITIEYKDIKATIKVGSSKMILNGKECNIFEPTIRGNRTFVQLKLINEIFGARLTYIYHTRSIKIEY